MHRRRVSTTTPTPTSWRSGCCAGRWTCSTCSPTCAAPSSWRGSACPRDETARWDDISRRMFVPFHGDGIISQFEGYEKLAELDWERYRSAVRQHPAPRPHPRGGERQREPLQALEAGRRADAVLSVLRRGAGRAVRAPRAIRSSTRPFRATSPTTTAARPTAPRYRAWCMRGCWRARTGRARWPTSRRRCRAT